MRMCADNSYKKEILKFLKTADMDIEDIEVELEEFDVNKLPKDMNDSESIMLAGIPNAPSLYNPLQNKNLAIERQRQVINKMIKYGNLDKVEAEKIIK